MKTLIILRHGKSSWDDHKLRDFDRPLKNKGRRRTQLIADYLNQHDLKPQLIVSSPALRAIDTARIAANGLGYELSEIVQNEALYFVTTEKYFEALYAAPDNINTLMIVGHNPMITDFCNSFIEHPVDNIPTSGMCVVSFDTEKWQDIHSAKPQLLHLVFPKKLEL
jgi:phosphohistidine phosphatase